ncbi:MAG: hypothetical protein GY845_24590, partial [Planctomycetes bacterium]|nr:hypothetical protein [Planctomycetota bacterium]
HAMVCENCGNEANMIIKEEETSVAEHKPKPKKTTIVCRNCGNEANMILEEVEIED